MLDTRRGSEDGFVVRRFYKDCTYDVADSLAQAFIRAGWAIKLREPSPPSRG
ncbi:MAG: hypothetical protein KGJ21_01585 [Pseudomonadota bacterium]|nr:hypothetical protein [Pseudomonadota bacterium]